MSFVFVVLNQVQQKPHQEEREVLNKGKIVRNSCYKSTEIILAVLFYLSNANWIYICQITLPGNYMRHISQDIFQATL